MLTLITCNLLSCGSTSGQQLTASVCFEMQNLVEYSTVSTDSTCRIEDKLHRGLGAYWSSYYFTARVLVVLYRRWTPKQKLELYP